MNARKHFSVAITLALSGVLAVGCGAPSSPATDSGDPSAEASFIGRQVARGIAKAQHKLQTENIRIGSDSRSGLHINGHNFGIGRSADGLPRAEITPAGALLINGNEVPATAEQRELALAYRGQLVGLAQAGMAIGAQGADIAGTALTGIGQAVFGGKQGRKAYEERIQAEADRIKLEAARLCTLMPALYDSQQALAAAQPEFVPYATMTREDVEDCGKGTDLATIQPGNAEGAM